MTEKPVKNINFGRRKDERLKVNKEMNQQGKVKQELDQVVGANKNVEESHLDDLQYLQGIVKETLR